MDCKEKYCFYPEKLKSVLPHKTTTRRRSQKILWKGMTFMSKLLLLLSNLPRNFFPQRSGKWRSSRISTPKWNWASSNSKWLLCSFVLSGTTVDKSEGLGSCCRLCITLIWVLFSSIELCFFLAGASVADVRMTWSSRKEFETTCCCSEFVFLVLSLKIGSRKWLGIDTKFLFRKFSV